MNTQEIRISKEMAEYIINRLSSKNGTGMSYKAIANTLSHTTASLDEIPEMAFKIAMVESGFDGNKIATFPEYIWFPHESLGLEMEQEIYRANRYIITKDLVEYIPLSKDSESNAVFIDLISANTCDKPSPADIVKIINGEVQDTCAEIDQEQ